MHSSIFSTKAVPYATVVAAVGPYFPAPFSQSSHLCCLALNGISNLLSVSAFSFFSHFLLARQIDPASSFKNVIGNLRQRALIRWCKRFENQM